LATTAAKVLHALGAAGDNLTPAATDSRRPNKYDAAARASIASLVVIVMATTAPTPKKEP
jgi:hypothetical protein